MRRLFGFLFFFAVSAGCNDSEVMLPGPTTLVSKGDTDLVSAQAEASRMLAEFVPFEFDFQLTDVSGQPISKSEFKGKVLIVDLWGTWCPPCRQEIPHFVALYEKYKGQGLEVVGLNSERGVPDAQAQTVRQFRSRNNIPYRCAVVSERVIEQVTPFEGFPTTLFFDRTGKLRLKLVGYHEIANLQAVTETLLNEPKASE